MSIESSAALGYGFKIPKSLENTADNLKDLIRNDLDLEFAFGGDTYSQKGTQTFCCIAKSLFETYSWNGGVLQISPKKLVVQVKWNARLKAWAKQNGVAKPKIGWYLLTSV